MSNNEAESITQGLEPSGAIVPTQEMVLPADDHQAFDRLIEPYRQELQLHCYRFFGSLQDAEDMVQETMLRAWRRFDSFEGRSSLRTWLYKIATNACLDALDKRSRRILPALTYPAADPHQALEPGLAEPIWLEPYPDQEWGQVTTNPEARYSLLESVSLAFLVALQVLPPRQRAILILRDVLDWSAGEVAHLLETTVSAVHSAVHRARTTLSQHYHADEPAVLPSSAVDTATQTLLDQYVQAWETVDVDKLVALLKEDATFTMPPSPSWYQGRRAIGIFVSRFVFAHHQAQPWRLRPARANGQPAFGLYQASSDGAYQALGIQVLRIDRAGAGGQIADITTFMMPRLVPYFGLPQMIS